MGNTAGKPVKKKVLFLLEAFDKGGIEKVTLDIVNNLDPKQYDITVQTFWFGGHCQSLVHKNVRVIPFFFRHYVRGIIRLIEYLTPSLLYRLFVHGDYDVEIAASDGGAAKVISGSTNKNAKKICWVHMDVVENGSKLKEFLSAETGRRIYEKFDSICCVSAECLRKFQMKFGDFPNMYAVHNPVPDKEVLEEATKLIPYKIDPDICTFVTVGRLVSEKGFDRLIDGCKQLVDEGKKGFVVHIVGDGPQRKMLENRASAYGLRRYIIFDGFQSNPYPYIANADWYICTSRDEAYPLTIGESFILHVPVIGTKCAGVNEWLGKSEYGIVVDNSTEGIVHGIKRALMMCAAEYNVWKEKAVRKSCELNFVQQLKEWENVVISDDQ